MFQTIIKAAENFCIHQICKEHQVTDSDVTAKLLITYIDIDGLDGTKHRVYLASETKFMQTISTIFLEEDESDEETLIDMALETANLVVGSAKVIAEAAEKNVFTIQTPHFIKIDTFDFEYDKKKTIEIDNNKMIIAIKGV